MSIIFDDARSSDAWEKLSQVAIKGAEYDSPERRPHPKCLAGTRVDLLNHIYGLLDNGETNQIIWLHGTAGVGKSAVAFTVAERMRGLRVAERNTQLAGTFFFSRKYTKRHTTGYFFVTLAYQLASNFASIREDVNHAICENPALLDPDTSLRDQMEALFLQPLRKLRFRLRECSSIVFVVDALDECMSKAELSALISLLGQTLHEPDLPTTHIFFTSRLEVHIREAIHKEEMRSLVCEIPVQTSGQGVAPLISLDGVDIDNDIYIFLEHSFKELGSHYPNFPQPTEDELARLVSRAGRHFIVASTMMKFVADGYNDPRDRLQLMLELTCGMLPGTEVYKLYDYILSTCADPVQAFLHLSIVAALEDPLPISQISQLLGPDQGRDVETVLVQLRSVVDIPTNSSLPVNIYHSSIGDYVSNPSNCCFLRGQSIQPPHSLLAYSSFLLMIQDLPESTALLGALSELERRSQAIQFHNSKGLKHSLAFVVQPLEPIQVFVTLLWLQGYHRSDIQSWLETADGHSWLETGEGKDWLQVEEGNNWFQTRAGDNWLQTQRGKNWLWTEGGQDWLWTQSGREWLQTMSGQGWLQIQRGRDWLQAHGGSKDLLQSQGGVWAWLQTQREIRNWLQTHGQDWVQTQSGQDWLQTPGGQGWLQTSSGQYWLEIQSGRGWLQSQSGQSWLQSPSGHIWLCVKGGKDWLQTQAGNDWLLTGLGHIWLQEQGGKDWLQIQSGKDWLWSHGGKNWLRTKGGDEWLQTLQGQEWLQSHGDSWLQTDGWLQTDSGRSWLWTEGGLDWLQTSTGLGWLRTIRGRDRLRARRNEEVQAQNKQHWQQTQSGRDWLQTQSGREWLQTQSGRDWLQIANGREWLQAQSGQDWLQTQGGRDWLQTQSGRDWLQTQSGQDWLQTSHGQSWLSTRAASTWVTMEEFLNTFEAIDRHIIIPELFSQPLAAFQAIQQFKSLPDFLIFPVFLALRHQDHSTSATLTDGCGTVDIISAMISFANFANEARERSRSASDALKYACKNWAVHLSQTPNPWGDALHHSFEVFWNNYLLSWLEQQWCSKGLQSCLVTLSEGQKLAMEHLQA